MKPSIKDKFLPIEKLANYIDEERYFCYFVSFCPEEDEVDFYDDRNQYPPPFIEIIEKSNDKVWRFEIPAIVAYYAKTHPGYTYKGLEQREKAGERKFKQKLQDMLKI